MKNKLIILLIILLTAIQFIQPARNTGVQAIPQSFIDTFRVNNTVKNILTVSCFDCHSNNTRYLWYTNIQPISWMIAKHIKDGKAELNFDELAALSPRRRNSKFRSITEQIEKDEMPLKSYLILHKDGRLSEEDKNTLINFFQSKINNAENR